MFLRYLFNPRQRVIDEALNIWRNHAILREGKRLRVYKDSLGKPTVGIGHLVRKSDNLKVGDIIGEELCEKFFVKDSKRALKTSIRQSDELGIFSAEFLAALISVNFQLGDWSKVFYGSYPKLVNGDWRACVLGLKRSLWNRQTPVRVKDFVNAIEKEFKND